MSALRFQIGDETLYVDSNLIDVWGSQKQEDGSLKPFVAYHSGEKSIAIAPSESLESLDKRITAAKYGRPAPKRPAAKKRK